MYENGKRVNGYQKKKLHKNKIKKNMLNGIGILALGKM